jgi:hypothetical protein
MKGYVEYATQVNCSREHSREDILQNVDLMRLDRNTCF